MTEIWKQYIGNYYISNIGRLKNNKTNCILKVRPNHEGYLFTVIRYNNKKKAIIIHRAVAEMFIINIYNKNEVNHKDGNKLNNNMNNLEWVTNKENIQHAIDNNLLDNKREKNPSSKLLEKDIEFIRNNYIPNNKDYSYNALARKFNVSKTNIYLILKNKTWK